MIKNGQKANQDNLNAAFASRTVDTSLTGKVALTNTTDAASGGSIANVQRAVNETFDAVGITGEGDLTRKQYSSTNYVSSGDSHKIAIGKLDAQAKVQTTAPVQASQVTGSLPIAQVLGTLPITQGGTGNTTQSAAFDALSPLTTKADLIVRSATTNARLPAGSDSQVLTVDSTQALGVKWATVSSANPNVTNATGVLPVANGGTGAMTKVAAFNSLSPITTVGDLIGYDGANNVRVPVGLAGQVLTVDPAQTSKLKWSAPAGGSGYNYFPGGNFEAGVTPSYAAVTITNGLPSGTPTVSSTANSITLSAETSAPLRGTTSLKATAAASWAAGDGFPIGDQYTIDPLDRGRNINVRVNYAVTSGSTGFKFGGKPTTQGLMIAVYDVTAAAFLPSPAGSLNFFTANASQTVVSSFQASSVVGQKYQAFILNAIATGAPATVLFDEISIGPGDVNNPDQKPITFNGNASAVSASANTAIPLTSSLDRSGGWNGTQYTVPTSGDYIAVLSGQNSAVGGYFQAAVNGTVPPNSYTSYPSAANNTSSGTLFLLNLKAGDVITFRTVVAGSVSLSASLIRIGGQSGSSSDSRVIAAKFGLTATTAVSANQPIPFNSVSFDFGNGFVTGGRYQAPQTGIYNLTLHGVSSGGSAFTVFVYKNGVSDTQLVTYTTDNFTRPGMTLIQLAANDLVDVRPENAQSFTAATRLNIHMLQGPSQGGLTDSVVCTYALTTAATFGGNVPIKYDTQIADSRGVYSKTTGLITIQDTGTYAISFTGNINTGSGVTGYVQVNGIGAGQLVIYTGLNTPFSNTVGLGRLAAGTTVAVAGSVNAVYNGPVANIGYTNQITLTRTGN